MKVGVCGDNVPNLPGNPKVKTIGSTLLSYPVMCCLAPFLGCSYLEQSKLGSHILFTQVHLGLTEKDGQRPESEQCGHAEESVDPQSRALLGNLAADQEAIRRTNPLFLLAHVDKGDTKAPKPGLHLPTGFSGLSLSRGHPALGPVGRWCSDISSRTQR